MTQVLWLDYWYPCFGLLVTSDLGVKATGMILRFSSGVTASIAFSSFVLTQN